MKGQNWIKHLIRMGIFWWILGTELRIATTQFLNERQEYEVTKDQKMHNNELNHGTNDNVNLKQTEDFIYLKAEAEESQNMSNNSDLLVSNGDYNLSSSSSNTQPKQGQDIIFSIVGNSTLDSLNTLNEMKPPEKGSEWLETSTQTAHKTNYALIRRSEGIGLFAPRTNYTADARLQNENIINQSDVLHLDVHDDNESDDNKLFGIPGEVGEGLTDVEAPGSAENTNATDRKRTISSNDGTDEDNLAMAWWVQLLWTAVFVLMILTAIGGNCIVMWIVIAHKRMRTVTNYFLVNLSCADLLLSTLNCFFNFIYMLQGNWQFGGWYCTVNNFIANTTVAASVFTLTAMCCDRYFAIVHPLHPRMSKVTAIVVIVLIWCLSMGLATPCLFFSTTITYRSNKAERTACILIWPDGQPTDSQMDFGYQVLFLVITYIVPMVLMSFFYTSIGRVLWGSQSIGERTQMQLDAIKSKRKVVKMIIFIVLLFAICWLPYHAYFIYTHFDRSILYTKYVQHVYLAFYWFAMANAMVNPLIYYWMNAKFRGYFRRAICCWRAHDHDFDANLNGRTFKSTRCEEDETRISLRFLRHSNTLSTTAGSRNKNSR